MAKDNQILVRVNDPTNEAIEEFAENYDFNNAEAVRRIVEDRLAGEGYLDQTVQSAIPDGGDLLSKTEDIESQVEELDTHLQEENEEPEISKPLILLLSGALLWGIGDIVIDYPDSILIVSGLVLIGALLYVWYNQVVR